MNTTSLINSSVWRRLVTKHNGRGFFKNLRDFTGYANQLLAPLHEQYPNASLSVTTRSKSRPLSPANLKPVILGKTFLHNGVDHKFCNLCKQVKPTTEYHAAASANGIQSKCKVCQRSLVDINEKKISPVDLHLRKVWSSMKQRCYNTSAQYYHRYGGRGISVEQFLLNINNFVKFTKPLYIQALKDHPNLDSRAIQLDRINNEGNYTRKNLRFVTRDVNMGNRSNTIFVEYDNTKIPLTQCIAQFGNPTVKPDTIRTRYLYLGWSLEDALTRAKGEKK